MEPSPDNPCDLADRAAGGDEAAAADLAPLVYDELRRIAGGYMRRERPGQTIEPTALVHEAFVRLMQGAQPDWQGRTHFLAVAARSMRQILIERARAKQTAKRGGDRDRITLDESVLAVDGAGDGAVDVDLLAIDEALEALAALDEQQARIVELRFFGGLTIEEAAAALDISPATVKRHWTVAKAWLRREVRLGRQRDRQTEGAAGRGGEHVADAVAGDELEGDGGS